YAPQRASIQRIERLCFVPDSGQARSHQPRRRVTVLSAAIPILVTPRLILRPLDLADAGAIQTLFPQWEVVRFLASRVPWPYPADGALTFIRDMRFQRCSRARSGIGRSGSRVCLTS